MNTTVTSNGNIPNFSLPQGVDPEALANSGATKSINGPELQKLLQELLQQVNTAGSNGQGKDPITNERGAPRLDAPNEAFSADDMVDLLRSLRSKSQDEQLRASQTGIESARIRAEKNTEKQLEKIKEWIAKCKEADSKSTLGKIFGWIGKAFAFVAAIAAVAVAAVATVATAGAAAPFLAFAIVGAVSATVTLASAISQELGGPELSIGNLIKNTVGRFLTDVCGVDPKVADKISNIVGGALALTCPIMIAIEPSLVGNMVASIAEFAGADEKTAAYIGMGVSIAASIGIGIAMAVASGGTSVAGSVADIAAKTMVQTTKVISTVINASSTIVSGATQITSGALQITKAKSQEEADKAMAAKQELQAMMMKLQQYMEEERENMKKVIQEIEASAQMVSSMLAGTTDNMKQVVQNMSGNQAV